MGPTERQPDRRILARFNQVCQRRSKDASARRSKDTSRMMAGKRPAGRLPASRSFVGWDVRDAGRSGRTLAALALLEPIAVAVPFEDVDVVREPVEQRAGEPLGCEHAGPLIERPCAVA